jgi:integrase
MAESKPSRRRKGRRARGTGSIFFHHARNCWVGRGPGGKPEVSGKTQAEVVRKLEHAQPAGPGITVSAWADHWLEGLSVRPATRAGYEESLRLHLLPAFGTLPVGEVKPSHIERLAVALKTRGMNGDDGGLHVNTILKVLDHARALFAAAEREGLIDRNPVTLARRPKAERTEVEPFSPDELRRLVVEAATFSAGPTIALLATSGCRLGEASALDVTDWDPKTGNLSISKTYSKRFGLGPPKSKYSRRTITVPSAARPHLAAAVGERTTGPLFVTGNDNRFIKSLVQRAFTRLQQRLGLPVRNVHQLRHSVATALISAGEPIGDVAKYLGDSVTTVVKTYLHPTGADPAAAIDRIIGA